MAILCHNIAYIKDDADRNPIGITADDLTRNRTVAIIVITGFGNSQGTSGNRFTTILPYKSHFQKGTSVLPYAHGHCHSYFRVSFVTAVSIESRLCYSDLPRACSCASLNIRIRILTDDLSHNGGIVVLGKSIRKYKRNLRHLVGNNQCGIPYSFRIITDIKSPVKGK